MNQINFTKNLEFINRVINEKRPPILKMLIKQIPTNKSVEPMKKDKSKKIKKKIKRLKKQLAENTFLYFKLHSDKPQNYILDSFFHQATIAAILVKIDSLQISQNPD